MKTYNYYQIEKAKGASKTFIMSVKAETLTLADVEFKNQTGIDPAKDRSVVVAIERKSHV